MRRFELAVDAVEGVSHGMGDVCALEIFLKGKDVVANDDDVVVLFFGNAPGENMNLAGILRKISGDLLANESVGEVANFQTTVDGVVVGDRDEIHFALEQLSMQLARVGIRIRKIKPPEEPFFRTRAETGVNVKITFAHIELEAALETLLGNPILIGRRRPAAIHLTDKIDNLPPNGRMRKVRRMNTETHKRFAFEGLAERGVPSQARHPSPTISHAVDQRSCPKRFAGTQIAHRPEPCGVFHFCIAGCLLCFAAEQPRRRNKTSRL